MKKILILLLAVFFVMLSATAQNAVYVTMKVTPTDATVTLDGQKQKLSATGELIVRLPSGEHSYEVTAKGYAKRTASFSLGTERMDFTIDLKSLMASLSVRCATLGAEIFIDGKSMSLDSWSGQLLPGSHVVEVRHKQYHTTQRTIVLDDNDDQQLDIPALTPRIGSIDVAYMPIDAEVYLDGKLIGTSPAMFPDILIGDYWLEIQSPGYVSQRKRITIEEYKTLSFEGSLEKSANGKVPSNNTKKPFPVQGALKVQKVNIDDLSDQAINIDDLRDNSVLQPQKVEESKQEDEEDEKVYNVVEQPPTFPGGEAALLKYIATHVKYPQIAQEQDIQGVVNLRLVVKEDGSVGDVQVARSLESHCDAEAIRVVKSLPKFIPGKQQGKAVKVWFSLPVRFQLQ